MMKSTMDQKLARGVVRIGKELSESLLVGYSQEYGIGLGVALLILWECANDKKDGEGQSLTTSQVLDWVRDLQKAKEAVKGLVIS